MRQIFSAERLEHMAASVHRQVRDAVALPQTANTTLRKLSAGGISVEIRSTDLADLAASVRYAVNVLLVGMVGAGFVLAAGLVLLSSERPDSAWEAISAVTFSGFGLAIVIALVVVYLVLTRR